MVPADGIVQQPTVTARSSSEQCFDHLLKPVTRFDCCVYANSTLESAECAPRHTCMRSVDLKKAITVSDCSQCLPNASPNCMKTPSYLLYSTSSFERDERDER
mmetsp:Transcript_13590/g.40994  ORF Transcript_13590/g.40994 Transcript_13590/m.40994 type:complete len:103 (+) Transcript_13590:169-477(+)